LEIMRVLNSFWVEMILVKGRNMVQYQKLCKESVAGL
jgi:hypothetical protein